MGRAVVEAIIFCKSINDSPSECYGFRTILYDFVFVAFIASGKVLKPKFVIKLAIQTAMISYMNTDITNRPAGRIVRMAVLSALIGASIVCNAANADRKKLTSLVNPFLGTETMTDSSELGFRPTWRTWGAEVFPGSSLPNAMVQLSPVTKFRSGSGYQYENSQIYGFSHTSKGHWNLNHIPIMPVDASATIGDYGSDFSHDEEEAHPAYYAVHLKRYNVDVHLTSTLRAGIHSYRFRNNPSEELVLLNLPRANEAVRGWELEQVSDNAVCGFQNTGYNVYFYITSNHRLAAVDSLTSYTGGLIEDDRYAAGAGAHSRKYLSPIPLLHFVPEGGTPLELRIGISFTSVDGARANLEAETSGKTFSQIREEGDETWEALLSKILVEGGNEQQRSTFYSTFYRSFLWPALRSDADGSFLAPDGNVKINGHRYYTDPSYWDDYRNKLVLLGMISPDVAADVIVSSTERGRKKGFMPTFFHGDHAAAFVAGSYLRGITDFDVDETYRLLLRNATVPGPSRPYLEEYLQRGWISELELHHPHTATEAKASVTKTQEYSYDDYAVMLMASALGDDEIAAMLKERIHNYKKLFNPDRGLFMGRLEDGSWVRDFDPCYPYFTYMYREATGWMSSFFAPHDTEGLIELYGGPEKFESKLDSLFTVPWKGYEAHNLSGFIGQYCHGNQPDHTCPFLYSFIGKPEKTQAVIDLILNRYYSFGKHHLAYAGMDDAGEMSSWYVLSAIGLYTYSPADPEYLVTVPIFDRVAFRLGENTFTIRKSGEGRRLAGFSYDGKPADGLFISHNELLRGKELVIDTEK